MKRTQGKIKKRKRNKNKKVKTRVFSTLGVILGILLLFLGLWNTSFVKERMAAALGGEAYQRKVYAQQKDLAKSKYGEESSSDSEKKKMEKKKPKKKKTHKKKKPKAESSELNSIEMSISSSSSEQVEAASSSMDNSQAQNQAQKQVSKISDNNSGNIGVSQSGSDYTPFTLPARQETKTAASTSTQNSIPAEQEGDPQKNIADNIGAGHN